MSEQHISIAGAVTYWTLAEFSDAQKLSEGLEAIGLGPYAPIRPTPLVAVKRALTETFTKRRHLIRPLDNDKYAVVSEEKRGPNDLDYEVIFRVHADRTDNLSFDKPDHPAVPAFEEAYHRQRKQVPAGAVGSALAAIAHILGGVRLRESGGVFWIPSGEALDKWEAVAGVITSAANEGRAVVYRLRTAIDDSTVEAVSDAITRDVEDSIEDIRKKLKDQERYSSFEKRKSEAVALDARVARYESILGKTLDALRKQAKDAENEASLAALAAMGGE